MKILQVVPYFTPKRGGDVAVCYNISKHLAERGHSVTIITTDFEFDQDYAKTLEEKGIQVIPFHCTINLSLFLISPSMNTWLKSNLKNYDLAQVHAYRCYQNIILRYYAKKFKIRYILQAHGSILPAYQKRLIKRIFDFLFGYSILNDASKVLALTKTEIEQYKKYGVNRNKIELIPNGVDLLEYSNLPNKGAFKKKYGIADNQKIILYLGRIHKNKGIDILISSFAELVKKLDDVKLVVVGPDYGFIDDLKKQTTQLKIKEKVLFIDPLFGKNKIEAYVDADIFVTPTYSGFPVTFLEACACGIPIVTTNKGDELEWINTVGYLVDYNENEICDAMYNILIDSKKVQGFKREANRLIFEEFNWAVIINRLELLFVEVVKNQETLR